MNGPEYQRSRLLRAAVMLRKAELDSTRQLAVIYRLEQRVHVLEVCNRETKKTVRFKSESCLDLPTYPELVEAILTRFRV